MAWTEDPHPAEPPRKRGGETPGKRFYADKLLLLLGAGKKLTRSCVLGAGIISLSVALQSSGGLDGSWFSPREDSENRAGRTAN